MAQLRTGRAGMQFAESLAISVFLFATSSKGESGINILPRSAKTNAVPRYPDSVLERESFTF